MREDESLSGVESRIGHPFGRSALLEQALTHRSRAAENGDLRGSNERFEFLGDAVLDLVVSELLMESHPDADEGLLTQARADLVNKRALAERSAALGLDRAVRLGSGQEQDGTRGLASVLADAFEAVLAAIYLDGGLEAARQFISATHGERLRDLPVALKDPKTRLQEWVHKRGREQVEYVVLAERGPPHAREFDAEVRVGGRALGTGSGLSKVAAQMEAARRALEALDD